MSKLRKLKPVAGLCLAASLFALTGCTSDNKYDADYLRKQIPSADTYFDFNTKKDVALSIDYKMPQYRALIEVYGENPLEVDTEKGTVTKKKDVEAIFKAYTDKNCKFEGNMNIAGHLSKVYVYTRQMGLPQCMELDITNDRVAYTAKSNRKAAATRAYTFDGDAPYSIPVSTYWGGINNSFFSICSWGGYGHITTPDYLTDGKDAEFTDLLSRARYKLWQGADAKREGLDNRDLMTSAGHMNLYIDPEAKDAQGNLIEKVKLDVTFVHESAYYRNSFGYYYYKESEGFNADNLCKFVVFPDVSSVGSHPYANTTFQYTSLPLATADVTAPLSIGDKVRLKFFGEDGKGEASDEFPAGYVVGWFMLSNGYQAGDELAWTYMGYHSSNDEFVKSTPLEMNYAFITLQDSKTGKVVIGIEDSNGGIDWSCEDMLFYVEADPKEAIVDPERPVIPEEEPEEDDLATETTFGTLAYEDIWPDGGDYDMNDVIIEYKRGVTFNKDNNVQMIADTFKVVQKHNGAIYHNAFAYQVDALQMGSVTLPEGAIVESETNSIIVFANAREEIGKTFIVTREFTESTTFNKSELVAYKPYIIVNYVAGEVDRTEVHLPKNEPTILANTNLGLKEKNIWFIDKDGKYPYAIELPILNFTIVTETYHIDDEAEYPDFAGWCESRGETHTDWYLNYKGTNQ